MPDAQSLIPAHAKGGTGSIGLPMDVRVLARKRDPLGSDREDAHRDGGDAHMNGSTVASPQVGPLLHAPPFPAAGCRAPDIRVRMCASTVTSRKRAPAPRSGAPTHEPSLTLGPFPEGEGSHALPSPSGRRCAGARSRIGATWSRDRHNAEQGSRLRDATVEPIMGA